MVNPWNHDHVAGGSSGGSAVAVAAGLCYATIDTDAIGSGRLPAAICGVTCHKPTFGLLSGEGILEGEPVDPAILILGHPCVTARSAQDVAWVLRSIRALGADVSARHDGGARPRTRVGIVTNGSADVDIAERFAAAQDVLRRMHVTVVNVEVPFATASFDLRPVESDRARIDATLFRDVDAIVLPTLATSAPTVAEARAKGNLAVSAQHTFFANYFGLPAVTVPLPARSDEPPTGLQFVGPHQSDAELLALAATYQRAAGWRYVPPASVRTDLTPSRR